MPDSGEVIREVANQLGIEIADDRIEAVAANYEASLQEADAVRVEVTPMPAPSAFDAGWELYR